MFRLWPSSVADEHATVADDIYIYIERESGFCQLAGMLKVAPNYRYMLTLLHKLQVSLISSADFCIIFLSHLFEWTLNI